jgi:hypothetical protein
MTMQYVMLVRVDPDLAGPDDVDVEPWIEEGTRSGMRVAGGPVEDQDTATTVRVRADGTEVNDGQAVAAREFVAGYDLLEADDVDEVVAYAAKHPVAEFGALEVREVWDDFVPEGPEHEAEPVDEGNDYLFVHVPQPELLATATRETGDPTPWVRETERRHVNLGGFRLRDEPSASTVIRKRAGEVLITRGPFAETAEQVAGIDRLRVADLDEAIALAAAHPTAHLGAIEIRPFRHA